MRKKYMHSDLRNPLVYVPLGLVGVWFLYTLVTKIASEGFAAVPWLEIGVLAVLIGGLAYYLLNLRMEIKIGRKSLKVRMNQWWPRKVKIKWKKVENVEPFEIPEALMWSGHTINFDHSVNQFRLGDNKGLRIQLKSGETYLIYSNQLFEAQERIKELIALRKETG